MSSLESLVGSMTVAELARFANTTVETVVALAFPGATVANPAPRRARAAKAAAAPARKTAGRPRKVARGGLATDKVLAVVAAAKGPIDAQSIRGRVGGSAAQLRAALKKLAEGGKIKVSGERRGTRYTAR